MGGSLLILSSQDSRHSEQDAAVGMAFAPQLAHSQMLAMSPAWGLPGPAASRTTALVAPAFSNPGAVLESRFDSMRTHAIGPMFDEQPDVDERVKLKVVKKMNIMRPKKQQRSNKDRKPA